jgi:hypothetical protein
MIEIRFAQVPAARFERLVPLLRGHAIVGRVIESVQEFVQDGDGSGQAIRVSSIPGRRGFVPV